ncbi:hypothetical protein ENU1_172870 [Entamoeba nuttalli P19]|uniref:Uncharacterized protein n=1 Tax=Entamoeba nuttalli (strain P19) TaxID=1076696 RepID=K2H6V7_ENTNP|nr:hypothetical protein ENU1_172870 [Entamoeba nuttalli P19]EKE38224.1 hypothetical protein ENU1_172870 [Entamoeba nuttalli P19]|eukprot:XP_008859441.1 hypothetical protein ENU1_172870 [Entamoeba nuttalli P19]
MFSAWGQATGADQDPVMKDLNNSQDQMFGHMMAAGAAADSGNEQEANRQAAAAMGTMFGAQMHMFQQAQQNQ